MYTDGSPPPWTLPRPDEGSSSPDPKTPPPHFGVLWSPIARIRTELVPPDPRATPERSAHSTTPSNGFEMCAGPPLLWSDGASTSSPTANIAWSHRFSWLTYPYRSAIWLVIPPILMN